MPIARDYGSETTTENDARDNCSYWMLVDVHGGLIKIKTESSN